MLDADLQDPPGRMLEMLEGWKEGYDVVYGVRRYPRRACYCGRPTPILPVAQVVSHIDLPLDAGDFCVMDRRVVRLLNEMPEHNRFVRGLRGWVGFRQIGVGYERHERTAGRRNTTFPVSPNWRSTV